MLKKLVILFLSISVFYACTSSDTEEPTVADDFDRGLMLTNIADNIIIPVLQDFSTKMSNLKSDGETFNANPNQTNLDALRISWFSAYKTWQQVEMFNIGKAEELQYSFHMNIYPLTVADVEDNIANGNYDLDNVNNQDAQGFPALDYLLYGIADSDSAIITKYTTATNNDNYKKYLIDVLTQMNSLTEQVLTDWTTSYRNDFISSTSNTATSAVNKLVNDYIFYFEKGLRANKFGIPGGVFSSTPLPEKVEGFYSKEYSKELALEALIAIENLFNGRSYNSSSNGISFNNYLLELDREDISTSIINQIAIAKTQINTLNANFFEQINTDNTTMTKSYDELQKIVVFLKVDMLQAFDINVDFVDADGD